MVVKLMACLEALVGTRMRVPAALCEPLGETSLDGDALVVEA